MSSDENEFHAPEGDGWYYTILRDWIPMCPDLSPTSIQLYWIVRSLLHEKGDRVRTLTIDELCWLLPGNNGKDTKPTRIKDALRELKAVGLLSSPDEGENTGTKRRWQIHDFPDRDTGRDSYDGWKSVLHKLNAYPGSNWRELGPDERPSPRQVQDQPKREPRRKNDRAVDNTRSEKRPGRKNDRPRSEKRPGPGRKNDAGKPVNRQNTPPKEVRKEGTSNSPSVNDHLTARAGNGRTDDRPIEEDLRAGSEASVAATLVDAPAIQADLTRIDLRPGQRRQLIAEVDRALLRFPEAKVEAYLAAKTREASTVKWLLTAFREYGDSIRLIDAQVRSAGPLDETLLAALSEARSSAPASAAAEAEQRPLWPRAVPADQRPAVVTRPRNDTPRDLADRVPDAKYLPRRLRRRPEAS